MEPTLYALTLSVEAFIKREESKPSQFQNKRDIMLAKRFIDRIKLPPFSGATTIHELKNLFEREVEILSDQQIGEQLSFFPTPSTNKSIARIDRNLTQNIQMYKTFIEVCDCKTLVAPRFSVIDKHVIQGTTKVIEVWLVDSRDLIPPERFGSCNSTNSFEYRVARGFAKDKLKTYYPNGVNPKDRFPQFPRK